MFPSETIPTRSTPSPGDVVGLVVDEKTLRHSLRFAFSNHYTVVQELLQNARRAGATQIDVQYDLESQRLVVTDDGCGLQDFQVLLRYAASGWSEGVAAEEGPYGLGFLAAVYAAEDVLIASGDRQLRFNSAQLLEGATFRIEPAEAPVRGTRVELTKVALADPNALMQKLARGYPVPITFNGAVLPRIHAVDEPTRIFKATEVGLISIPPIDPGSHRLIYLQGFLVHVSPSPWGDLGMATVIHLDSTRWRGRFPDRDRCIDESIMLKAVEHSTQAMLEERLLIMKATLPPAQFCASAYGLARRLQRLDVFNDVDVVPASWFGVIASLPHATTASWESCLDDVGDEDATFTRKQFESGEYLVTEFADTDYPEWSSQDLSTKTPPQLAWMLAYRLGVNVLMTPLDPGHWLYPLIRFDDETPIDVELVGAGRTAEMPYERTNRIGGIRVQLCQSAQLKFDVLSGVVDEPWVGKVADGEVTLFVPVGSFVDEYTLRQYDSYTIEDELQDDELSQDVEQVNHFLRGMLTEHPKERLQLALRAALHDYRPSVKGFKSFTVEVDEHGEVTVTAATERQKSQPANAD